MKPTLNEKFLAYLALFSGITLSIVAEYYSILGLMAIFSTAPWSVVVMGIALGVGKITATLWLKQNWSIAPWSIRSYLLSAIAVLMLITSMGIFGFLSKAHSDQSLVSGDVQAKIAVYDEKIKTAKDNIDANRKALKQMDEAVDQIMGRSTTETGADKAVAIRRAQAKERVRLQSEIATEQKTITQLNEERAPIAAEVRKVEAEVGPIKYIATFVYGETDPTILEKAVTWVIIVLIVVFDPLAVILLLSSQISFQNFRERNNPTERELEEFADAFNEIFNDPYIADVGEKPTAEELAEIQTEGDSPQEPNNVVKSTSTVTTSILAQHPYLLEPFVHFKDLQPLVYKAEKTEPPQGFTADEAKAALITVGILNEDGTLKKEGIPDSDVSQIEWDKLPQDGYVTIKGERMNVRAARDMYGPKHLVSNYIQNEEQTESGIWNKVITEQEYRLKLEKDKNEPNNNPSNPT